MFCSQADFAFWVWRCDASTPSQQSSIHVLRGRGRYAEPFVGLIALLPAKAADAAKAMIVVNGRAGVCVTFRDAVGYKGCVTCPIAGPRISPLFG